jgi:hypothetical protein
MIVGEIGIVAEIEVFQDCARDSGERFLVRRHQDSVLVESIPAAASQPLTPER